MINSVGVGSNYQNSRIEISSAKKSEKLQDNGVENKVEAITKQIKDGNYKIDINSLAKRIAEDFI